MVEENNTQAEPDMVQRAIAERERLEKVLAEAKDVYAKNQATEARIILGGQSVASASVQEKIETPAEYKARIMRGGI